MVEISPTVIPIFEGLYDGYINSDYDKGFNKMYDSLVVDNNEWRMAGSRAQKDILPLTMLNLGFEDWKCDKVKCLMNARLYDEYILTI